MLLPGDKNQNIIALSRMDIQIVSTLAKFSQLIKWCFHDGGSHQFHRRFLRSLFLPHRITQRVKIVDKNLHMQLQTHKRKWFHMFKCSNCWLWSINWKTVAKRNCLHSCKILPVYWLYYVFMTAGHINSIADFFKVFFAPQDNTEGKDRR